jgi:hypothetical protein
LPPDVAAVSDLASAVSLVQGFEFRDDSATMVRPAWADVVIDYNVLGRKDVAGMGFGTNV